MDIHVPPVGIKGIDFPSSGGAHAVVFNSTRGVLVLFGGAASIVDICGDTWEWDGTAWTDASPGGAAGGGFPTGRYNHAMTYDSARGVAVLFGGDDNAAGLLGDTWIWNGSFWVNASPAGTAGVDFPTARHSHSMAYDSTRDVVVLFGGDDGAFCSDTWEWNGTAWNDVLPGGVAGTNFPSPRYNHAMTYDSTRGVVVLFGGDDGTLCSDTWEWNGSVWTDVSPGGVEGTNFPTARRSHAMVYDSALDIVVLFGGDDGSYCSDTWEWNGTTWTDVSPGGVAGTDFPLARHSHAVAYDSGGGALLLFGGTGTGGRLGDAWEWNGSAWSDVSTTGTDGVDFPSARYNHAMTYDPVRSVIIVFGGDNGSYCSDIWEY
jgi:hypothetical protein